MTTILTGQTVLRSVLLLRLVFVLPCLAYVLRSYSLDSH